jgi:hypothetical protein
MKLNKDNYTKTIDPEYITYMYNCNDTNFYMRIKRGTNNTDITLFSGSIEDPQNEVKTDNALTAWNTFEDMLDACAPEQASSGGFAQDRQNPNFLPLLAIKKLSNGENFVSVFLVDDKGEQKLMEQFTITAEAMPSTIPQDSVFVVDWSNQDIMMVLKCEVLMLPYPKVEFNDDKNAQVFLFIPKSIGDQGGEEGGNTQAGEQGEQKEGEQKEGEGKEGEGKEGDGKEGEGKEAEDEGKEGEGKKGEGKEGQDKEGEGKEGDGKEGEGKEAEDEGKEGEGKKGKPTDKEPENKNQQNQDITGGQGPIKYASKDEVINKLAESIDMPPQNIERSFRNVDVGELFLQVQDFEKIKKDLNLPPQTTARSLSEQIINLQ